MKRFSIAALLFSFSLFCGQIASAQTNYNPEDGIYAPMNTALCGQSLVNDFPNNQIYIFQPSSAGCPYYDFSGKYERWNGALFFRILSTDHTIAEADIQYCQNNPTLGTCPVYFDQSGFLIAFAGNKVKKARVLNVLSSKAFKFTRALLLLRNEDKIRNVIQFDGDDYVFVKKGNFRSKNPTARID